MTPVEEGAEEVNQGALMALTEAMNIVDDEHTRASSMHLLNHGVKIFWNRACADHPLTDNGLSITEFVNRCPPDGFALLGLPSSEKRRLPNTREPANEGPAVFLKQIRQFVKFLNSADEGDLICALGRTSGDRFWDGLRMVVQPPSPRFSDVVDLPSSSASSDDVGHTDGDEVLVKQGIQRLIEARANHAHGVG